MLLHVLSVYTIHHVYEFVALTSTYKDFWLFATLTTHADFQWIVLPRGVMLTEMVMLPK